MFYRALSEEQSVRVRRARPMIAFALVAFAAGAIVGANSGGSASDALAARFVASWSRGDYAAMYADVDAATKRSVTADGLAAAYAEAKRTATATRLAIRGKPRADSDG